MKKAFFRKSKHESNNGEPNPSLHFQNLRNFELEGRQLVDNKAELHLSKDVRNWVLREAPCATDILWDQFCSKFSFYNWVFSVLLNIVLFLITILCVSPVTFLENFYFLR